MRTAAKLTTIVLTIFLISVGMRSLTHRETLYQGPLLTYSDSVKAVIDAKCYNCHSLQGRSEEAKEHLLWDSLPVLSLAKQIHALDKIVDVINDGSMPPKMMVSRNPDAALTEAQSKLLRTWAETTADNLLK